MQFRVVTPDSHAEIDGRVIAHVLDQVSDRPHALIEGVDGIVSYIPHDSVIAEARANGKVRPKCIHPASDGDCWGLARADGRGLG